MKAIRTRYHGPSSIRGSRISASTGEKGQKVVISYPDELNSSDAHALVARKLVNKMKWSGDLIGGGFPDGTMVWVFTNSPDRA